VLRNGERIVGERLSTAVTGARSGQERHAAAHALERFAKSDVMRIGIASI
jgi:hypothetical protein